MDAYYRDAIDRLMAGEAESRSDVQRLKVQLCTEHGKARVPSNADILERCGPAERKALAPLLKTKPTRSLSGVAVVTVQTSPWACPHGTCTFCPGGPQWGTAQSYTGKEPAARRAARHAFDAHDQAAARLEGLHKGGHPVDKVDVIIQGGTFPARPRRYQRDFVRRLFDALNAHRRPHYEPAGSVAEAHAFNEAEAKSRCIGLTIETKPDWASPQQMDHCLELGATRIELGVQTVHDEALRATNRGHGEAANREATRTVKDAGLKVCHHVMPGLPGATFADDLETFRRLFEDPGYRPDMLKVYPLLVIPDTEIHAQWEAGAYEPPSLDYCIELIAEAKKRYVPPWVRIQRVDRDIPTPMIDGGVQKTNLREYVHWRLELEGARCRCVRCREAGHRRRKDGVEADPHNVALHHTTYAASGGVEHFISYEDADADVLVAFVRLREPGPAAHRPESRSPVAYAEHLEGAAIVRELRAVGVEVPLHERRRKAWQHQGYGRRLMDAAEEAAREAGRHRVLVTSGVGVRDYYRKLGYERAGPYMAKDL